MKASLINFTKRLACVLSACVVAVYSFVSSFCFGVHAADLSHTLEAVADYVVAFGKAAISMTLSNNPMIAFGITSVIDLATEQIKASTGEPISVSVTPSNISSFSGYAPYNNENCLVYFSTWESTTFTFNTYSLFTDYGCDHYFPLFKVVGDSFTYKLSICPVPYQTEAPYLYENGDYIVAHTTYSNDSTNAVRTINYFFSCYDSSGTAVTRPLKALYKVEKISNTGTSTYRVYGRSLVTPSYHLTLRFAGTASSFSFDDIVTNILNLNDPAVAVYDIGPRRWENVWPILLGNGSGLTYPTAPGFTTFTTENVYEYLNTVNYPYIVNNYPEFNTVINSPSYYLPEEETTNPTTPSDSIEPTGTGAVIIIDPFTLPPEWVESDVVELDTESYTIDYDSYIGDPMTNVDYPLLPDGTLQGGANILSYGIQFLKDGGIFYILCTLLVLGLLIRFLGI